MPEPEPRMRCGVWKDPISIPLSWEVSMRVRELLRRKKGPDVITVPTSADVATAAHLLIERTIGGLPVVGPDGVLLGFVSERDIVRAVHKLSGDVNRRRVEEIMRRPAPTCTSEDTLKAVMSRMTKQRLRHLVVLDGDKVAGVISVGDLVRHRMEELETETGVLRDVVVAQRARG